MARKPTVSRRDPSHALQAIFDGWYNPAHWDDFMDLLETMLLNACKAKADGSLNAEEFFRGRGRDPKGVRKRVATPHVREKLVRAAELVIENSREPLYRRASNPEVLGQAYCALQSNRRLGQFFTPWEISLLTATITCTTIGADGEAELRERVLTCMREHGLPTPEGVITTKEIFVTNLPFLREHFEPIRMLEPCVGAGSMLLAFASTVPPWALSIGAVQITAIDLDPRAIQMSRINCLLHGVPARLYVGNFLRMEQLKAIPAPFGDAYSKVRQALDTGDLAGAKAAAVAAVGYAPDFSVPPKRKQKSA